MSRHVNCGVMFAGPLVLIGLCMGVVCLLLAGEILAQTPQGQLRPQSAEFTGRAFAPADARPGETSTGETSTGETSTGETSTGETRDGGIRAESQWIKKLRPQALQNGFAAALNSVLARPWQARYQDVLAPIRAEQTRYIQGFSAPNLSEDDAGTLVLTVLVRIDLAALVTRLRQLGLPLVGDAVHELLLVYPQAASPLQDPAIMADLRASLAPRLAALNLTVKAAIAVDSETAAFLQHPGAQNFTTRRTWLQDTSAALVLMLYYPPGQLRALFYLTRSGETLGQFAVPLKGSTPTAHHQAVRALREGLTPERLRLSSFFTTASRHPLRITLSGLAEPQQQQEFAQLLFVGRPLLAALPTLTGFRLELLGHQQLTYRGTHELPPKVLSRQLKGRTLGDFHVQQTRVQGQTLVLQVRARKPTASRPVRMIQTLELPSQVQRLLSASENSGWLTQPGHAEVEDNHWFDRANLVVSGQVVYARVSAYRDRDFFALQQPQSARYLHWQRLGRTQLKPALRIYNARREWITTLRPGARKRVRYRLPANTGALFVEVSDQLRAPELQDSGFTHFHYVLQFTR